MKIKNGVVEQFLKKQRKISAMTRRPSILQQ